MCTLLMRSFAQSTSHLICHSGPFTHGQCLQKQAFSAWRSGSSKLDWSPLKAASRISAVCSNRLVGGAHNFIKVLISAPKRTFKQYACRQAGKRSWEVNLNVPKDTLIFSYDSSKYFKMMTVCGIAQYLFWLNMSSFAFTSFKGHDHDELTKVVNDDTLWGKAVLYQAKYKYRAAVTCLVVGNIVLFFTIIYPLRSVSKLMLLAGGNDVRITTYSYFGKTRSFQAPLESISCQHSRTQSKSQLSLKVKGHWFFYLLDQKSGHFHQPRLFDNGIGILRNLKK